MCSNMEEMSLSQQQHLQTGLLAPLEEVRGRGQVGKKLLTLPLKIKKQADFKCIGISYRQKLSP